MNRRDQLATCGFCGELVSESTGEYFYCVDGVEVQRCEDCGALELDCSCPTPCATCDSKTCEGGCGGEGAT